MGLSVTLAGVDGPSQRLTAKQTNQATLAALQGLVNAAKGFPLSEPFNFDLAPQIGADGSLSLVLATWTGEYGQDRRVGSGGQPVVVWPNWMTTGYEATEDRGSLTTVAELGGSWRRVANTAALENPFGEYWATYKSSNSDSYAQDVTDAQAALQAGRPLTKLQVTLTVDLDELGLFAGGEANKVDMLQSAIKSITGGGQGSLLEMQGGLGAVRAWPDWMVPKPLRKGMWKPTGNAFSFTPDGDAYESIKAGIRNARMGKAGRPEMGDVALAQMKGIDQLESYLQQNLSSILAGAPNTLTPAQQIQVMDLVTKKLLPNWDNVHAAASNHGRKMGEWVMMDFNDRRNFDTALALVLPFHYYFTRSAGNWLQRIASKPALLDLYLETQGATE
jgi:hypothetical protein